MASVRILGPIEVWAHDRRIDVGGPRQVALLASLVLNANRGVSSDQLIDWLWEKEPGGSRKRLQMAISRLRQSLAPVHGRGDVALTTVAGGYLLSLDESELDAEVFRAGVREGQRALHAGDPERAAVHLRGALGLWRGRPLAQVSFQDFALPEIRRLEEVHLGALEARIQADLELGHHAELLDELSVLSLDHPEREAIAAQLMLALYRSGRQVEALEAYQRIRSHLAHELGLDPGAALTTLQTRILTQDPELAIYHRPTRTDALSGAELADWRAQSADQVRRPPAVPTPTIGRRRLVDEITTLLRDRLTRLVTLVGPGGVGKTRVALTVAHDMSPGIPGGSVWVDLAGLARPDEVGSAIVRAFAITPIAGENNLDALRRHLSREQLLVVVDNFEHVLPAAALLGELLAGCPRLRALVTSREPLNLAGEHRVEVGPLAVPADAVRLTVAEVEATDATALFLAAARRQARDFQVTRESASAIGAICAELDGLPLAMELAAARVGAVGLAGLRLWTRESRSNLGSGPRDGPARQHTLRATIDWSHRLLTRDERAAFARFAVFAGGATLEAAQSVTGASLETLEALIAKSLLSRRLRDDGAVRLVMLDTIREYARDRLHADPDCGTISRAHLAYYLDVARQHVPSLLTHDVVRAKGVLDAEIDNILSALKWSIEADPASGLTLAGVVGEYWVVTHDRGGLEWVDAAIDAAGISAPLDVRARACLMRSMLASYGGDSSQHTVDDLKMALSLYRQSGDDAGISETLSALAVTVGVVNDDLEQERRYAEEACRHARLAYDDGLLGRALARLAAATTRDRAPILSEAVEILERVGNHRELAVAYSDAAYVSIAAGDIAEATDLLEHALRAIGHTDDYWTAAMITGNLGLAHLFAGRPQEARRAFQQNLTMYDPPARAYDIGEPLAGLAAVAAADGHFDAAARLRGAARAAGYPPAAFDRHIDDRLERDYFAPARAAWGGSRWEHAERLGAASPPGEILAYALDDVQSTKTT